jgi:hypothetical protein
LIAPWKKSDKEVENVPKTIWFADFEADVNGPIHIPYMCCLQNEDGSIQLSFGGEECGKRMLEYLPDRSLVYFHNLAYDLCFQAKYGITFRIKKGSKTMASRINYKGKKIFLKDSLSVIPAPLKKFPEMFKLDAGQKEIFPYKYYRIDFRQIGIISEAGLNEKPQWTEDQFKQFSDNIDLIPGCRIDKDRFDMRSYAHFYCQQDVRILREGFNKFREDLCSEFNIDVKEFISISGVANESILTKRLLS